ncbi:FxsA family protein [Nocardioides daejeonensis]|uniref:FxsA family protein n=1 Tax=Nocardioides daejeonensis TaxID=1046556 RepID=UPI000D74AC9D|nr:FxsA family protein [Nocardioides daejeonensis]
MRARRRVPLWLVALLFLVIPLVELYVLIQVGKVIGVGWTILLLIADSVLGGWLIKREGGRAFRNLAAALSEGRMPSREIADGILILAGGILMLSPGFVLDILGLVLVLPVTRPLARGLMTRFVEARMMPSAFGAGAFGPGAATPPGYDEPRPRSQGTGPVVEGEVVDGDEGRS